MKTSQTSKLSHTWILVLLIVLVAIVVTGLVSAWVLSRGVTVVVQPTAALDKAAANQ